MRVLVAGSRLWANVHAIANVLGMLHEHYRFTLLIHGGAKGVDTLAGQWAKLAGVTVLPFPVSDAEWQKLGAAAGPKRNRRMLDEGKPDIVVAFPGGDGTADLVRAAKARSIRIIDCDP